MSSLAAEFSEVSHRYGKRLALDGVSFSVTAGQLFGLLGPNGGGKTTAFKILATLMVPTSGRVSVFGYDVTRDPSPVRRSIGVLFQSPAVDKKLSVKENLVHQGHLYGMRGRALLERVEQLLTLLGLLDRLGERVELLSGGLKRRLEIAKALLHRPRLLILDEPTAGLDPLVRRELWSYLSQLRRAENITILVTTHILEEADGCDQITLLDKGRVVARASPDELKRSLGGDVISIGAKEPEILSRKLATKFGISSMILDHTIRIERANGHEFIPRLVSEFAEEIDSVLLSKPTLEDYFIQKTGHGLLPKPSELQPREGPLS